jgi:hypothetical protein
MEPMFRNHIDSPTEKVREFPLKANLIEQIGPFSEAHKKVNVAALGRLPPTNGPEQANIDCPMPNRHAEDFVPVLPKHLGLSLSCLSTRGCPNPRLIPLRRFATWADSYYWTGGAPRVGASMAG